jgi:hypothetical protein
MTFRAKIGGPLLFCYSSFNLYTWYSEGIIYGGRSVSRAISYHTEPGFFTLLAIISVLGFLLFGPGMLLVLYKRPFDKSKK